MSAALPTHYYAWAAEAVVLVHFLFIAFACFGGFWVWRAPRVMWLHLPAVVWGVLVEINHWICPLTPLENHLRALAGQNGYTGGFISHYLWPIIYPAGLTKEIQWVLGGALLLGNGVIYTFILRRWLRQHR